VELKNKAGGEFCRAGTIEVRTQLAKRGRGPEVDVV
jgi:hypothetical protein